MKLKFNYAFLVMRLRKKTLLAITFKDEGVTLPPILTVLLRLAFYSDFGIIAIWE
jgi:hypothetical protein